MLNRDHRTGMSYLEATIHNLSLNDKFDRIFEMKPSVTYDLPEDVVIFGASNPVENENEVVQMNNKSNYMSEHSNVKFDDAIQNLLKSFSKKSSVDSESADPSGIEESLQIFLIVSNRSRSYILPDDMYIVAASNPTE